MSVRNPAAPADTFRDPSALPQSREAERALLGAMIVNNEVIGDVIEFVGTREMFAYPAHRTIYEIVIKLFTEQKPVFQETVPGTSEWVASGR